MNRRDALVVAAMAPSIVGAQTETGTAVDEFRMFLDSQARREAELHGKLLEVWEWLDIWGDMLPDGAKDDLLKSLGPDPGVRIAR